MNFVSDDDLAAFEWEAEYVSKQVKDLLDGTISIEKFEEKKRAKEEKKLREEREYQLKQEMKKIEKEDKLKRGFPGKGEKDDYVCLCKKCFVQYSIEMPKCFHCNRDTITKEERKKELLGKLEDFKKEDAKKKIRKNKFENFLKTEQWLKNKNFANYKKWEMYDVESDEEEKEPILPRDDPNFIALEKDMTENRKKREECRKRADGLKDQANAYMKELRFNKAIKKYTEAIDEQKGVMSYYTNRALAYIKVEEYDNAIKDCDKVIEYLDIFEDEKKKNLDLLVKALVRKSQALSKLNEFDEAVSVINEAIELKKENPNATVELDQVKNTIEDDKKLFSLANETSTKLENTDSYKERIEKLAQFVSKLKILTNDVIEPKDIILTEDIDEIVSLLKSDTELRLYFLNKGWIELTLLRIKYNAAFVRIL